MDSLLAIGTLVLAATNIVSNVLTYYSSRKTLKDFAEKMEKLVSAIRDSHPPAV
jgi:hypothetical protein